MMSSSPSLLPSCQVRCLCHCRMFHGCGLLPTKPSWACCHLDFTTQRARVETTCVRHEVGHDGDILHAALREGTHTRRTLVSGSRAFIGSLHLTAPSVSSGLLQIPQGICFAAHGNDRNSGGRLLLLSCGGAVHRWICVRSPVAASLDAAVSVTASLAARQSLFFLDSNQRWALNMNCRTGSLPDPR